jgi:signal-transduction protein with cAMP-binding, CBS, and nucleotidyltransferase domain
METAKDILAAKGKDIVGVSPDSTLLEALEKMADRNVGAVLVLDPSGDVLGIFTERDFARKIIIKGRAIETTKVREAMTERVLYVGPETKISDCMNLMTEKRVRHLPVMEGRKAIGIVSIGDVVKAILEQQQLLIHRQAAEIGQLERYTTGGAA